MSGWVRSCWLGELACSDEGRQAGVQVGKFEWVGEWLGREAGTHMGKVASRVGLCQGCQVNIGCCCCCCCSPSAGVQVIGCGNEHGRCCASLSQRLKLNLQDSTAGHSTTQHVVA